MKKVIMTTVFDDPEKSSTILHTTVCDKKIVIPMIEQFDTCDIILFYDKTYVPSKLVDWFTIDSKYSRIGLVLKDPKFINPLLKGAYMLEISNDFDEKNKVVIKIRKFIDIYKEYNGAIFWRKLNVDRDENFNNKFKDVCRTLLDNSKDLVETLFDAKLDSIQVTKKMLCCAMITYIYDRLDLVNKTSFDSQKSPNGVVNILTNLSSLTKCNIDKEIVIKEYDSYVHHIYYTY